MKRSILSFLITFSALGLVLAQENESTDTDKKGKKLRLAVRLGTDLSVLASSLYSTINPNSNITRQKSEYGGDLMINNRYFITLDF